jgi:hypothetical protein
MRRRGLLNGNLFDPCLISTGCGDRRSRRVSALLIPFYLAL